MLTIISIVLLIISLIVILAIILKKFPALAILDLENISSEKEAEFKNKIMKARLDRDLSKLGTAVKRSFLKINKFLSQALNKAQANLKKMKLKHGGVKDLPLEQKLKKIKNLHLEAEDFIREEEYLQAEEKLLEIISLDASHLGAFFDLASVYDELKKISEARQTYEHALRLAKRYPDQALGEFSVQEIFFSLAELEQRADNIEAALDNILEALEIEPNNPRFLDLILNLSIIKKDKISALKYLDKLAKVNPENQKLEELKEELMSLEMN